MAIKKARASTLIALPAQQWAYRMMLVLMVMTGLTMLVMSKTNNPNVTRLRLTISDTLVPVLSAAASPLDAVSRAGMWIGEMIDLRAENVRLKNQNIQLMQWQSAAKEMQVENSSLRHLLNTVPSQQISYITARVVSDLGGPYVRSALINGGSDSGVKKDEAVINESGLVGRVVDVGKTSSRILLLSDINSRVPVMVEGSREKSIMVGHNLEQPTLSYLSADSKVKIGDRLVTSGDGGIFPQGIAVGIVSGIDKGAVKVQPFVDPAQIEYINVVDFSL